MAEKITDHKPNVPSFDFDPETGKPQLQAGETIVQVTEEAGIPVYSTDAGRVIYACSIAEYEAKVAGLYRAHVWRHFYPQAATDKLKKFKVDKSLLGAVGKAAKVTPATNTGGGGGVDE